MQKLVDDLLRYQNHLADMKVSTSTMKTNKKTVHSMFDLTKLSESTSPCMLNLCSWRGPHVSKTYKVT